jgi:hypothetical protein
LTRISWFQPSSWRDRENIVVSHITPSRIAYFQSTLTVNGAD